MKRIATVVALATSFVAPNLSAQTSPWKWQNPLPAGNTIHELHFVNPLVGWAAGDAGTVLHTADGGITWQALKSGGARSIVDIQFFDESNGWAVEDFSRELMQTADGGTSWQIVEPATGDNWGGLFFADPQNGWLAGASRQVVGRTTDGGATWDRTEIAETGFFNDIFFVDDRNGWVVGSPAAIFRTRDGGDTWTSQNANQSNPNGSFLAVHFTDTLNGWAVGQGGAAAQTADGGETWVEFNPGGGLYTDVHFADTQNGWISSNTQSVDGTVVRHTSDGGATWEQQATGALGDLNSVNFRDAIHGYTAGAGGQILFTNDGGVTWTERTVGTRDVFWDVLFLDEQSGFAERPVVTGPVQAPFAKLSNGGSHTVTTNNGGEDWSDTSDLECSKLTIKVANSPNYNNNVTMLARVCGQSWADTAELLRTGKRNEAGSLTIEWRRIETGEGGEVNAISMPDTLRWWVVGQDGLIRATADSGATWSDQVSGTTEHLKTVFFVDAESGWAAGFNGTILHTSDGGQNWSTQTSGTTRGLNEIHFVSPDRGWIVGDGGTILETSDGGQTWESASVPVFSRLRDVDFGDDRHGVIVGDFGTILRTTDGGETWIRDTPPTANQLLGVDFVDADNGWISGSNGTILRFDSEGLGTSSEQYPDVTSAGFALRQNYPNPFSATTTIEFEVPELAAVRVEVFDLLGRRVGMPVDEVKAPGRHATVFDSRSLPAGMYLCRLSTAGRSQVVRMAVIR